MKTCAKMKTATPKHGAVARTVKTGKAPAKKTSSKKLTRKGHGPMHEMVFKPFGM